MESRGLKVLILEDQESDAVLMAHELRKAGYLVAWRRVDTEQAYLEELEHGDYQVILSDYALPSFNARRALQLFRGRKMDIPFIVVTGSLGEEQAVELMRMGASDYLIKDRLARLGSAVSAALEQKRLRDDNRGTLLQLKKSEERFRRIVENAPDTHFRYRIGTDEGFEYVSPAVENLTGYHPEDFYSDWTFILRIVHPEDLPALMAQFTAEKTMREPYFLRWIRKDGSTAWTEQRNLPVYDENGSLVAVEGVTREITDEVMRTREREAIISLVSALRDAVTRAEIAPVLLEKATELVKGDGAALTSSGNDDHILQVEACTDCWLGWEGNDLHIGEDLFQQVAIERQSYENTGIEQDPPDLPAAWVEGLSGLIVVPLIAQGEVMGLLWVGCRKESMHERLEGHLRVLIAIADIAASALYRARLFEETQQRVHHLTALRTIDRAITSSLDLHLTMNVLLDQLMLQRDVDAVDILLVDHYTHQLNYGGGRGFRGRVLEGMQQRMGESIAGQVILERRIVNIPDLNHYLKSFFQKTAFLADGFTSYLGVPLIAKGEVLGVLEILRRVAKEIDLEWLEFIESMASQVAIAIHNGELFETLQRTNHDIVQAYDATIGSWSRAMETREIEDRGHMERVVWWTTALGREMGIAESDLVHLRRGAVLHDIGKLALPDNILLKPGALTGEELILMRKHPVYAYEWLSPVIYLHSAIDIPYSHHESWDGQGYPRGLKGLQIPLSARIFALVDSWDALRADKPYRRAWTREQALKYIRDMSGVRYDPGVVEAFNKLAKEDPTEEDLAEL
jgi:PAS domain S-box-containing protein